MAKKKKDEGLGFKSFELINLALLAKQAWRLAMNSYSIWAQILKAIYFPSSKFGRQSATAMALGVGEASSTVEALLIKKSFGKLVMGGKF